MSSITATTKPSMTTTTSPRRLRRSVAVTVCAIAVIAAAIAVTAWLLVQSPTRHATTTAPPLTNVQKMGVAREAGNPFGSVGGDPCRPAPAQRPC